MQRGEVTGQTTDPKTGKTHRQIDLQFIKAETSRGISRGVGKPEM